MRMASPAPSVSRESASPWVANASSAAHARAARHRASRRWTTLSQPCNTALDVLVLLGTAVQERAPHRCGRSARRELADVLDLPLFAQPVNLGPGDFDSLQIGEELPDDR